MSDSLREIWSHAHVAAAGLLDTWSQFAEGDAEAEWHLQMARTNLWRLVAANQRRVDAIGAEISTDITRAQAAELQRELYSLSEEFERARAAFVDHLCDMLAPALGFDAQQRAELRRGFGAAGE